MLKQTIKGIQLYSVSFQGSHRSVDYLKDLGNRLNNSNVMKSVRNVSPVHLVLVGAVVGAGAYAAYYATKANQNASFSPFNSMINNVRPKSDNGQQVNFLA